MFLGRVVTVRDKDWNRVKKYFEIPKHPLELEKKEIELKQ
jgi:site-specific DNA-methyltransferase (adenine-specific)